MIKTAHSLISLVHPLRDGFCESFPQALLVYSNSIWNSQISSSVISYVVCNEFRGLGCLHTKWPIKEFDGFKSSLNTQAETGENSKKSKGTEHGVLNRALGKLTPALTVSRAREALSNISSVSSGVFFFLPTIHIPWTSINSRNDQIEETSSLANP